MRNRALRVCVAASLMFVACAVAESKEARNSPETKKPGNITQQPTPPPIVVNVSPPQKTNEEIEREAKEHDDKAGLDRRLVELTGDLAKYTLGLFIATAALVVATIGLFLIGRRQGRVMQGQLDEMKTTSMLTEETLIATQRPWIYVKITIGLRGLFFDANGVNLDLNFSLKNTGSTPAVTVRIEGSPRIDVGRNRMAELERVCDEAKKRSPSQEMRAYTIFPEDVLNLKFIYTFASKEQLDKENGVMFPVVIGCVDYFFTFGHPVHHQSRFVYELHCPIPGGGMSGINIADGDKDPLFLRLSPWIQAGSFQAD
jgi:hypothetical protein